MTDTARLGSLAIALLLLCGLVPPVQAAQIDVKHSTLEKLLSDPQRSDGKKYLSGQEGASSWLYVREARVVGEGGRLRLTAWLRFAFGGLEMPTEMRIALRARPQVTDGILSLAQSEVQIEGQPAGSLTSLVVDPLLRLAQIDLRKKLAELIQQDTGAEGVAFRLLDFAVRGPMQVQSDRTRLEVDFTLEVR